MPHGRFKITAIDSLFLHNLLTSSFRIATLLPEQVIANHNMSHARHLFTKWIEAKGVNFLRRLYLHEEKRIVIQVAIVVYIWLHPPIIVKFFKQRMLVDEATKISTHMMV